jgi:hypothetical protein
LKSTLVTRVATLTALFVVIVAPAAHADIGETIILRCTHGESLAGFSQSAYDKALKELSADAEEYSPCASQIRQAQLAAAGGHGASLPTGEVAKVAVTPAEQHALTQAGRARPTPLRVGGQLVQPGVVHANIASALSSLPSPLLASIAVVLACLLIVAGGALHKRLRGWRAD